MICPRSHSQEVAKVGAEALWHQGSSSGYGGWSQGSGVEWGHPLVCGCKQVLILLSLNIFIYKTKNTNLIIQVQCTFKMLIINADF